MTLIDYYCRRCHSQLERLGIDEVKNAFRNYVIYATYCPKCDRYITYVCEYGGHGEAPKDVCILSGPEGRAGAPSCMEADDGVLLWKCVHYIEEHILSRPELEAGVV